MSAISNKRGKNSPKSLDIINFTTRKALSPKDPDNVRFIFISDTHGKADELTLPPGDILIHCGDFTRACSAAEIKGFNQYLGSLKIYFKYIVVICGNHEKKFDPKHNKKHFKETRKQLSNCIYLEDESVNLLGFNIYGTPWQPEYRATGAFALPHGKREITVAKWNEIPEDTDILVSHGPPFGIGDCCRSGLCVGCPILLSAVQERVKPKIHAFGHIHEAYGIWTDDTTIFLNASSCNRKYEIVNKPIIVDLPSPLAPNTSNTLADV